MRKKYIFQNVRQFVYLFHSYKKNRPSYLNFHWSKYSTGMDEMKVTEFFAGKVTWYVV